MQNVCMQLMSFNVRMFRNVIDSGVVNADSRVTCLVGKNESGKTAILNALYRLNPVTTAEFDASKQYPRWRLSRDRKAGLVESTEPITATFALDDADKAAVAEKFGNNVLTSESLTISVAYTGDVGFELSVDPKAAARNVLSDLNVSEDLRSALGADILLGNLQGELAKLGASDAWSPAEVAEVASEAKTRVGTGHTDAAVFELLRERMPKFFYFSDYQMLPGRIDVRQLAGSGVPAESGIQTARALIALAGTDAESLTDDDFEDRKAELEAVSNELTEQVFKYWKQNEELSVEIDLDKVNERDAYQNVVAVPRYLDVRVKDRRHGFTNNFEQRSSGFRWFFSFLAAFSEFADYEHGVIVLLDEPALTLHGKAQADFLKYIENELSQSVQVIYTTHSPFMVDASRLDRVRVIEDQGPDRGAIASAEVLAVGDDSLFPLQAALGYDIAQNLYVGPDNLVVEGTSDFTYLNVLSDHLVSLGREGLNDRWRILPAGGATNIPAFVALVGRDLDVTTLIDGSPSGVAKLSHLAEQGLLNKKRLLILDQFTGIQPSDIEDLFEPKDYLALYTKAFKVKLAMSALTGKDRMVARITRATGAPFTAHGIPADYLLRNRDSVLAGLSSETLDRFESVFQAINATLR